MTVSQDLFLLLIVVVVADTLYSSFLKKSGFQFTSLSAGIFLLEPTDHSISFSCTSLVTTNVR